MKKTFLLLFLIGLIFNGNCQNDGQDKLGSWTMLFTNNKISEKMSIHAEAQYRNYEFAQNLNQLLLRTGLNYSIADHAIVTAGYGYITTDSSFEELAGEKNTVEHRIYEQFVLKNKIGKLNFSHRYRLEQRFISNPNSKTQTLHRARYFLRVTYPLNDQLYATAYDEVFVNLKSPHFGQNRLYGALGYKFSPKLRAELGYLKNTFDSKNFDRFQAAIFINTDLRKKKDKTVI